MTYLTAEFTVELKGNFLSDGREFLWVVDGFETNHLTGNGFLQAAQLLDGRVAVGLLSGDNC